MERVPLDGPNGGQQCEYNNINVNDVVMSEFHCLSAVWLEVPYSTVDCSLLLTPK